MIVLQGWSSFQKMHVRSAFDAIARLDGEVHVESLEPAWLWDTAARLLPISPFRVSTIEISAPAIDGSDVKDFPWLAGVRELALENASLEDSALRHIGEMKTLEALRLRECVASDQGFSNLSRLAGLKRLEIYKTNITDLSAIPTCRELQVLDAVGVPLSDAGATAICKCLKLRKLVLTGTRVSGHTMKMLGDCKELTELDVSNSPFDDVGCSYLGGCANLMRVELRRTAVTDSGISSLATLRRIEHLGLAQTKVTGLSAEFVKALSELRSVDLSRTRIGDGTVAALSELQKLTDVDLRETLITDASLAAR
jgi:Leucine-rich repeat (LRR) protein